MVPVLPDMGSVHPTEPAAPDAVPPLLSSLLSAFAKVFAKPSGTACSHGSMVYVTSSPWRSKILSTGVGGHHIPPEASVAATFDSSSALS